MALKDYYAVLGIGHGASAKEIKDAYRTMVLQYHPDVYQGDPQEGTRITQQLNEAFEILGDEQKRTEYDLLWKQTQPEAEDAKCQEPDAGQQEEHRQDDAAPNTKDEDRPTGRCGSITLMNLLYSAVAICLAITHFLVPWVRINDLQLVIWEVFAGLFGVYGELSTASWVILFLSALLLSGFLLSSLQAVKQIWSADDGGSAYYEAKGIAGLMIFENLVFRAILFVASLLFPTTQVYSTAVSIPYLVVGLLLLLILYLGWGGYSKNT